MTIEPDSNSAECRRWRRARRLGLITAASITAISAAVVAAPYADATDSGKRAGGPCDTNFTVDEKDPLLVHITGTCQLSFLGQTKMIAEQRLRPLPDGTIAIENESTYTGANGHALYGHFIGRATPNPATPGRLRLSGTEWYVGGTGQFENASGQAPLNGFAQFTGPTMGIGHYETRGALKL